MLFKKPCFLTQSPNARKCLQRFSSKPGLICFEQTIEIGESLNRLIVTYCNHDGLLENLETTPTRHLEKNSFVPTSSKASCPPFPAAKFSCIGCVNKRLTDSQDYANHTQECQRAEAEQEEDEKKNCNHCLAQKAVQAHIQIGSQQPHTHQQAYVTVISKHLWGLQPLVM